MSLFGGRDPKDDIIALLTDERNYLRVKVEELEKQLLAIHSTHAFRLVHGEEAPVAPVKPGTPDPYTLRAITYEPDRTLAAIENSFNRRGD